MWHVLRYGWMRTGAGQSHGANAVLRPKGNQKGASADLVHSCGNDLQGRFGVLHQGVKLFSEQKACCLGS